MRKHRVLSLLAAFGTLPLILSAALPAPADATTARGDYETFHRRVDAPRAAIDIRHGGAYDYDAVRHYADGTVLPGSRITVKVKDVRTLAQSHRFVQRFVVIFDETDGDTSYLFARRGDRVRNADTGRACKDAHATYRDRKNTVSIFIPYTCDPAAYYSVQAATLLYDRRGGMPLATDRGTLYEF